MKYLQVVKDLGVDSSSEKILVWIHQVKKS
jgi:hypothetical protein